MRDYELMVVLRPTLTDEELPASIEKISQSIATLGGQAGEAVHSAPWGRRRLAYPIRHMREGIYALLKLQLDGNRAIELDRALKLNEDVLRHLLTREGE